MGKARNIKEMVEDRLCERVVCEGVACERVVYERVVCDNSILCVCDKVVCEGVVCPRLPRKNTMTITNCRTCYRKGTSM